MAGAGWRDFIAGEVLTAANVQDYLQDQAVMTFASSAARGSAIASPTEGMVSYLTNSNLVEAYDGSSWKQIASTTGSVLQVVSATKTNTASITSTTMADISGLSVSITPKSTSSKILVLYTVNGSVATAGWSGYIQLVRGSTAIAIGDAAGSRSRVSGSLYPTNTAHVFSMSGNHLDSPATTSATTYKIQGMAQNASYAFVINRNGADADAVSEPRLASSITVLEIAG